MKIAHLITRLIIGGAQENTVLTCEGLQARGHEVTLITGPETGPEGSLLEQVRSARFDVVVVDELRRSVHPWQDARALGRLTALLRRLSPDLAHTHSSKAGILGRLAAARAGVPLIVHTIHGMSFNRTQSWPVRQVYRMLERLAARYTHRILTVADAMAAQAVAAGIAPPDRFTTVYSGMRTDWFDPSACDRSAIRERWGFQERDVVVGTVARLFRNKGYEQLIPAMEQAAGRNPDLRFVWVGDGSQRRHYEQDLERRGLRDRVRLTGLIPPREVAAVLAGIDLLVHASQWEGLPRAAVQALLMGRPVVSFAIDGAPEVVRPGQTGLLVPLHDTQGLARAILELAADPGLRERMGRAGRQLCLRQFDAGVMVEAIERVYLELAAARKRPPA